MWSQSWLPNINDSYVSSSSPVGKEDMRVCDLFIHGIRIWNMELLHSIFRDRNIQIIRSTPLAHTSLQDSWMWLGSRNCIYSVKSGYSTLTSVQYSPNTTIIEADLWKHLWKVQVPSKILEFT